MIGGAGFFMSFLENALKACGIKPVHAFSQRISVEKTNDVGEVIKHIGFVGL